MARHAPWTLLLAPMDCAGEHEGEERAPRALIDAGLPEAVAAGEVRELPTGIATSRRDAAAGVIGFEDLERSTRTLRAAVGAALGAGGRPLIVGGDCAIVPGILAGARDRIEDLALAFVDGHLDVMAGALSPTGEAADMDLAILTGHGPPALRPSLGRDVVVAPQDVAAVGFRPDAPAEASLPDGSLAGETALVDEGVHLFDARRFAEGAERLADDVSAVLGLERRPWWLHLDVDVLDADALPAVSYPQAGGPSWSELEALLTNMTARAAPVGAHVTCFNADLDHDGELAEQLVALVGRVLGPGP